MHGIDDYYQLARASGRFSSQYAVVVVVVVAVVIAVAVVVVVVAHKID